MLAGCEVYGKVEPENYGSERTCTDGYFGISNLSNPNPSHFGPESGSFIGVLSRNIFLAIIRYYFTITAYCSAREPVVI